VLREQNDARRRERQRKKRERDDALVVGFLLLYVACTFVAAVYLGHALVGAVP